MQHRNTILNTVLLLFNVCLITCQLPGQTEEKELTYTKARQNSALSILRKCYKESLPMCQKSGWGEYRGWQMVVAGRFVCKECLQHAVCFSGGPGTVHEDCCRAGWNDVNCEQYSSISTDIKAGPIKPPGLEVIESVSEDENVTEAPEVVQPHAINEPISGANDLLSILNKPTLFTHEHVWFSEPSVINEQAFSFEPKSINEPTETTNEKGLDNESTSINQSASVINEEVLVNEPKGFTEPTPIANEIYEQLETDFYLTPDTSNVYDPYQNIESPYILPGQQLSAYIKAASSATPSQNQFSDTLEAVLNEFLIGSETAIPEDPVFQYSSPVVQVQEAEPHLQIVEGVPQPQLPQLPDLDDSSEYLIDVLEPIQADVPEFVSEAELIQESPAEIEETDVVPEHQNLAHSPTPITSFPNLRPLPTGLLYRSAQRFPYGTVDPYSAPVHILDVYGHTNASPPSSQQTPSASSPTPIFKSISHLFGPSDLRNQEAFRQKQIPFQQINRRQPSVSPAQNSPNDFNRRNGVEGWIHQRLPAMWLQYMNNVEKALREQPSGQEYYKHLTDQAGNLFSSSKQEPKKKYSH